MEKKWQKGNEEMISLLTENSIALQKILADIATNLTNLTGKIESLLNLFEDAATNFKEKQKPIETKDNEIIDKINELNDQNRIIAKGVMLLEQAVRKQSEDTPLKPKPLPQSGI